MDGYKQKVIMAMAIHLVIFYCFQDVHGVRQKRKLIFLSGRQTHWNDHVLYCNSVHSGRLFTEENVTITFVLQKYASHHWSKWDASVWNGLYMSDFRNGHFFYRWQGTCQEAKYFNWKSHKPVIEKKCTQIDKDVFQWKEAKCDNAAYSICEKYIGPCTFEIDPEKNSCFMDSSTVCLNDVTSEPACLNLCSVQDNCWAVQYDEKTLKCWISSSSDPFRFDSGGSIYSSTCSASDMESAKLYWKRCFIPDEDTAPIPTFSHQMPTEPKPLCEFIVKATTPPPDEVTTTDKITTSISSLLSSSSSSSSTSSSTALHTMQSYPRSTAKGKAVTFTPENVTSRMSSSSQPNRKRTIGTHATRPYRSSTITEMSSTINVSGTFVDNPTTESFIKSTKQFNKSTSTEGKGTEKNLCQCRCHETIDIDAYIADVLISLKRNRKSMSKYKRKLISAEDNRVSSKTIGLSLGLGVIVSVVLTIVLSDACKFIKWLHKEKRSSKKNVQ